MPIKQLVAIIEPNMKSYKKNKNHNNRILVKYAKTIYLKKCQI